MTGLAECATAATGPYKQFYVGKKSKGTCDGNPPGSLVYIRVCAVGPLGPGLWSDIAQKRAT